MVYRVGKTRALGLAGDYIESRDRQVTGRGR